MAGSLAGAAMGGNPRIRRNARWLWPSQAIAWRMLANDAATITVAHLCV
jgi:hypothetical protein